MVSFAQWHPKCEVALLKCFIAYWLLAATLVNLSQTSPASQEEAAKNMPNKEGGGGRGRGIAGGSRPGPPARSDKGHLQSMLASVAALGQVRLSSWDVVTQ